jgi:hypothetical protein
MVSSCFQEEKIVSMSGNLESEEVEMFNKVVGVDLWIEKSLGKYKFYVPKEHPDGAMFITQNDKTMIFIMDDAITVMDRISNMPAITVYDKDQNGQIDSMYYDVFDGSGDSISTTKDSNFDGQADMRILYKEASAEVWVEGAWRPLKKLTELIMCKLMKFGNQFQEKMVSIT